MAYAEKRGKGPRPWRVKYKIPGGEASESGFETKQSALDWGRDQEAKVRAGIWMDPSAGEITVSEWIDRWLTMQDVGLNTEENREYHIRRFIRPYWGTRPLNSITGEEIASWERKLPDAERVSRTTAKSARGLFHTILGDAVAAKPPLILFNPAVRPRNRGRRTGRSLDRTPARVWATPLEVLLVAERAALLAGRDEEFTMLVTIGYTGMRWGETIGLEHSLLLADYINVEWQLSETKGRFHRQAPKDDDYRTTNRDPRLPVDLPSFLSVLLTAQANAHTQRCACAGRHDGSGRYVFLGPDGGHHRRSNYARRIFRPACDGQYPAANGKPARLVVADTTAWPGNPVAAWPPAVPEGPFTPPTGRGTTRLVSTDDTGRCPSCGYAIVLRQDGTIVAHETDNRQCPGTGQLPAEDTPLACWLPVKPGLTPHGLRHSHKTWMIEDGIPEILAEQRLGHQVPGMRGLYSHVSQPMRDTLTAALQARWEQSLADRAALNPHSPVPLLDDLLAPARDRLSASHLALVGEIDRPTEGDPISQISPNTDTAPIRKVG